MLQNDFTEMQRELKRQAVHLLVGILVIILFLMTNRLTAAGILIACIIIGYFVALHLKRKKTATFLHEIIKHVERAREQHFPGLPVFLFFIGAILTLLIFENPTVILAALIVISVGDSVATIIGKYSGRIELVSNRTLEGTVAGIIAASIVLSFFLPVPKSVAIAGIGMLAEYLPIDDNIGIPLVAGFTAMLLV